MTQLSTCDYIARTENLVGFMFILKYLSSLKYGFRALKQNEFQDLSPFNCLNLNPELCSTHTLSDPFYINLINLNILSVGFYMLAYIILQYVAKHKT